jgi:hypothetical protein
MLVTQNKRKNCRGRVHSKYLGPALSNEAERPNRDTVGPFCFELLVCQSTYYSFKCFRIIATRFSDNSK